MFRDKPSSVIYIEECLLNPPIFPGTLNTLEYIKELSLEFNQGKKSSNEISEIVGEIWGASCINVIIANSILFNSALSGNKREIKAVRKVRELLMLKVENIVGQTKALWSSTLDMHIVANGAAKNFDILITVGDVDSILGFELYVDENIRLARRVAVSNFSPTTLRTYLEDGIFALTGIKLIA